MLILFLLTACSGFSRNTMENNESPSGSIEMASEDSLDGGEAPEDSNEDKIISSYYIYLETLKFDSTRDKLDDSIKKHKGFIDNSNIGFGNYEYSTTYKYGNFTIRIPKENVDAFKLELANLGNITEESTSQENVTKFYKDTESRLKLFQAKEARLLDLLEKAEKIEDIIALESELTDTIHEKEVLERDLKSIDRDVNYSSINLQITEVRNLKSPDGENLPLRLRLKNAFKDSFFSFKVAVENFLVWLVFAIPYILILAALAGIVIFFIKIRRKPKA